VTIDIDVAAGQWITAGGISTHYLEAGHGHPVLLLHGSGPGVSAWSNWRLTIDALAQRFRVLAPEMVGYGTTARPPGIRYGVATWVDHVVAFLDALELDRVSIVGNSMGGLVTLHIAQRHPERLCRVVLMGAPGIGMRPTDGLAALRAYQPSPQAMRTLLTEYFAHDPAIVSEELVEERYRASAAPGVHEAYRAMFHDPRHGGDDLALDESALRDVAVPTLLVHGREDRVIPVDVAWTMVGVLPRADLHVFAECGHWTQIERAEHFNKIVGDFLEA
jgi:2-hydroxy-6-oxo-octa-2,4-dienoate hydrolase